MEGKPGVRLLFRSPCILILSQAIRESTRYSQSGVAVDDPLVAPALAREAEYANAALHHSEVMPNISESSLRVCIPNLP
jgi:hypothetical protein